MDVKPDPVENAKPDPVASAFMRNVQVESLVNRDGDILPYAYYNPLTEGRLTWMCGEDEEGRITSVFCFERGEGGKEKMCKYLENIEQARYFRDELVKGGWKKLIPPKVELSMPGADGKQIPLNRKQKRALAKMLSKGPNK